MTMMMMMMMIYRRRRNPLVIQNMYEIEMLTYYDEQTAKVMMAMRTHETSSSIQLRVNVNS